MRWLLYISLLTITFKLFGQANNPLYYNTCAAIYPIQFFAFNTFNLTVVIANSSLGTTQSNTPVKDFNTQFNAAPPTTDFNINFSSKDKFNNRNETVSFQLLTETME